MVKVFKNGPSNRMCSTNFTLSILEYLAPYKLKQPVYKQQALGWQIFKQLPGLNLFSLSNNKNYILKKSGVFPSQ